VNIVSPHHPTLVLDEKQAQSNKNKENAAASLLTISKGQTTTSWQKCYLPSPIPIHAKHGFDDVDDRNSRDTLSSRNSKLLPPPFSESDCEFIEEENNNTTTGIAFNHQNNIPGNNQGNNLLSKLSLHIDSEIVNSVNNNLGIAKDDKDFSNVTC